MRTEGQGRSVWLANPGTSREATRWRSRTADMEDEGCRTHWEELREEVGLVLRCLLAEEQGGVLQALHAEAFRVVRKISFLEVRREGGVVAQAVLLELELRQPALRDGQVSLRSTDAGQRSSKAVHGQEPSRLSAMTDGRYLPTA